INVIMLCCPILSKELGFGNNVLIFAAITGGVTLVAATIFASTFVDKIRRKHLFLVGGLYASLTSATPIHLHSDLLFTFVALKLNNPSTRKCAGIANMATAFQLSDLHNRTTSLPPISFAFPIQRRTKTGSDQKNKQEKKSFINDRDPTKSTAKELLSPFLIAFSTIY
ncbi:hypothetical protein FRX31_006243, partial [Thalictrum thalictroides]